MATKRRLSPTARAAALIVALGADQAAQVYKHLREEEVELLSLEVAKLERLSASDLQEIVNDFYGLCQTHKVISEGGILYAREILERAFGAQLAASYMNRVSNAMQTRAFEFVRKSNYKNLAMMLQNEHPQTIAFVLSYVTAYMQEAWNSFFPLKTELRSIETNGRLLQAFSPQDIVVIVSIEIKEERYTGTANMCMSAESLEGVIRSFSTKYMHSTKQQDPEKEKHKQEIIIDYLKSTDLEITAYLDTCQMSLADIMHLQVNDVVILNRRIDEDIVVEVEGIPWFTARIGEAHSKKAIKLVKAIDKEAMKREA